MKENQKRRKTGLWTKDFTCITAATALSAIGGEALNFPVSLLVFEKTQSTLLSALILVCGMLPDTVLPVLAAPLIDRGSRKKWIVGMDILLAVFCFGMGGLVAGNEFSYGAYVVFVLAVGTISVFYRLAYAAWYPDLIPRGAEQRGYAVSSALYPFITVVAAPAAAFLYERAEMEHLLFLAGALTLLSVAVESLIAETGVRQGERYPFRQYLQDIREGFSYLKKEKGIRNIYTYMSITNGISGGMDVLVQAFFQTSPLLSVTMLGILKSAEMIGRVVGGCVQYAVEIPVKRRYVFTKAVYLFYEMTDAVLLFLPYPLMLAGRFLCGGLGISSATIRETAVQSYLKPGMRARVNAFFDVAVSLGCVAFQLLAGLLGRVIPLRYAAAGFGLFGLGSIIVLIIIPAGVNRPVYEAVRREEDD